MDGSRGDALSVLKDPMNLPAEFKEWMVKYVDLHLPTRKGQDGAAGANGVVGAAGVAGANGYGAELDYVETASPLTVTATSEGAAQTYIAGNSIVFDGATRIKIEAFIVYAESISGTGVVSLFEDGSTLGWLFEVEDHTGVESASTLYGATFITPSAGSHTYSLRAWKTTGTLILTAKSRATKQEFPAFYRITVA